MAKKKSKIIGYSVLIIAILLTIATWRIHTLIFKPTISFSSTDQEYFFTIPTGSNVSSIAKKLYNEKLLTDTNGFVLIAKYTKLDERIYPGMYSLSQGMSNKDLVLLFRSGKRKHVALTIKFGRYAQDILKTTAPKIEAEYEELLALLKDKHFLDSLGVVPETAICLFIPDTYHFNWNTSAKDFFLRMHKEYTTFWNKTRLDKAQKLQLTPHQVMTLASIVDQETIKNDEKPRVAGVYLNRLAIDMPLQADPTVKFAVGDFSIKRVREGHKAKNSPYNTYMYNGLPPGPICTPSKSGIDAVLNYEKHEYFFFCAQPNYSGYHNFAKGFDQHLKNARIYQTWLNTQGIF